ncbi:shikimate kinase [Bacillus massiliglaciei]|uniref:shikimate kinase n=1 Tax=Bacillus massiliglaciei TaxID=1816693 RepID=UPI000A634F57|nr:shikimate kinase [Bacillus massiliglaciei]
MSNENIALQEKSLVFIGFMGAGKTTVGEAVAKELGREFIDIDQEIEQELKMPTSAIFEKIGEKAFREKEKTTIHKFCMEKQKVISVGGGAFLQQEIRDICLSECVVIFLDISWDAWKDRISLIMDSRPILQGKTTEQMKELFTNRQAIYSNHHLKIQTDGLEVKDITNRIIETLRLNPDVKTAK